MSDATKYSKLAYLMTIKESTAGTALYPNVAHELLSESMVSNWDFTPANTIAGNRSKNLRPIKNKVGPFNGSVTVLAEPKTLGHWLTGVFGVATDTTLLASVSYQHKFSPATTLKTYTMDIPIAGSSYVQRFIGTRVAGIDFSIADNKLQAAIALSAQKVFQNARVTTAASGGTALVLDQTSGLVAGSDTIIILDKDNPTTELCELTVTTVTSETVLVVSTIGVSIEVGDIAVIKKQTPTYSLSNELIFSGGASVYMYNGADGMQNLSTVTNCEDFKLSIKNDLEARWAATGCDVVDRMPSNILVKGVEVTGTFSNFYVNPLNLDVLRQMEQTAIRFEFCGATLDTNVAAAATGTIESDGVGTITVTVDAVGEAGNDWAVEFVQGTTPLAAAVSGKLITVTLDATPANNAVATVASAITALTGVSATSTGAGNVTTTDNPNKIAFSGGRDANEVEKLRFDMPDCRFQPFNANLSEDAICNEEISFTAYRDTSDKREIQVMLRNITAAY